MSSRRPGEFELIAKLFAPLAKNAPGAFGLTDDAALISPPPGEELAVTTDALIEGVHFLREDPADSVGRKSLRVNLSDLAAKGARPFGYFLVLALPDWPDMDWLAAFAGGLAEDQQAFDVALYGGDTTATPGPLTVAVTAFGTVPAGRMLRRAGASPGDIVYVSGGIGGGGGGLQILKNNCPGIPPKIAEELLRRYRLPEPRLALGTRLRGLASAALDVSDGLIADLGHIADVSGVHITLEAMRVPLAAGLQELWTRDAVTKAVTAGDDYEIAFTAPASARAQVLDAARQTATPVTEIGRVEKGKGVALLDASGREVPLPRRGYTHF